MFHPYLKLETVHCFHSSSSRIRFEIIRVFFPFLCSSSADTRRKKHRSKGFFVFQHKSSKVI
ncbi:hypothetical protein HanIR_Chr01g0027581 [Helianthus annuus]|nr:hypothetical protein HanIR_Chr01g0027581 [Helianthus annuus]